jgi:hypothetical protein
VLHLPPRFLLARLGVSSSPPMLAGHPPLPHLLSDASDVRGGVGPAWAHETSRKRSAGAGVWTLASPFCIDE